MTFSKDPKVVLADALSKGYARVRFQQGKPVLDRELNLLADLASPSRLAERYLGNGIPDRFNGFQITGLNVAANDFQVGPGLCLVGGLEAELPAPTTYRNQPVQTNVANLPPGVSNVYLRAFLSPVTEAQDASLNNAGPGDVGSVTSVRERVSWEVVVSAAPVNTSDHFLLAVIDTNANTVTDRRLLNTTLSAVRSELTEARGGATFLGNRLNTSLSAGGTLNPNVVGSTQLADASVTAQKLANQSVPIAKLSAVVVIDASTSLPANQETAISIDTTDGPAFHLISVAYVGPRPVLPPAANFTSFFNWTRRTRLLKPPGQAAFVHQSEIVFQNGMNSPITVAYKAYRLSEG